jgi:hypothetical protein
MRKYVWILASLLIALSASFLIPQDAWAFCGFYVAKADTKLYNQASQVILARDRDRTILTMANDYKGDVKDFALVVPVPVVLKREQVRVGDPKIVERLDAFSAPRLVEYFDSNPCDTRVFENRMSVSAQAPAPMAADKASRRSLGVTIEEKFTVGEYDILILSAKESNGLATWLQRNGYRIPKSAAPLLQPYVRQQMKFFVAKVNLETFKQSAYQSLRPLQIAYASPKFVLPIRLGMINSTGEQDLIAYVLSPKGQAEIINYRTVKVRSDLEIPVFVKPKFNDFYKAMFQTSYQREGRNVAFIEYAWNMGNCDPCSAEPLTSEELRKAGVFWLGEPSSSDFLPPPGVRPTPRRPIAPGLILPPQPSEGVFITRLHVRYTRDKFPEDLIFQETNNREQFQGRYVMRHPYTGEMNCTAGRQYQRSLRQRLEQEVQTLAKLTGWNVQALRQEMKTGNP